MLYVAVFALALEVGFGHGGDLMELLIHQALNGLLFLFVVLLGVVTVVWLKNAGTASAAAARLTSNVITVVTYLARMAIGVLGTFQLGSRRLTLT